MAKKQTKKKGKGRKMDKMINLWVPEELDEALKEAKWILRKDVSQILREASIEYLGKYLPDKEKDKFSKVLGKEK